LSEARDKVNDMIDIQKVLVTDHISELKADAAVANRRRRAGEEVGGAEGQGQRHRTATSNGVRERVGHWLVGVGEAIAGTPAQTDDGSSLPNAA
jgi:hypothetical protein